MSGVRADYSAIVRNADSADREWVSSPNLRRDLVKKVGLQMMAVYRLMRFAFDAGHPLVAQILSRCIRHLYGSDIHWEADLAPGVMLVHGMGLAISPLARVEPGVILYQHVTLGLGAHPVTRESGAPLIERDVQIGAGATIVGPIVIGARSRISAGCVIRDSVPPDSLVSMPEPVVRRSSRRRDERPV